MKNGWYHWSIGLVHYVDGYISNKNAPSRLENNKDKYWRIKKNNLSLLHRLDGPAIEYYDGNKEWYYQGVYVNCKSQGEFERYLKLKLLW